MEPGFHACLMWTSSIIFPYIAGKHSDQIYCIIFRHQSDCVEHTTHATVSSADSEPCGADNAPCDVGTGLLIPGFGDLEDL